jgi:hypothetical protein
VKSLESGKGEAFVNDELMSIEGVSSKEQLEACRRDKETFEKMNSQALDILKVNLERIVSDVALE